MDQPALEVDNSVAKPSPRVIELQDMRRLPLTLLGGTKAMREARQEFMPQHPAESENTYAVRLVGTHLYNGFAQTVSAQAGKLLGKPIVLSEETPKPIVDLAIDIDGQGRAISPFTLDVVKDAFACGVSYIWCDMPKMQPGATLADQMRTGVRPYWIHVKASQVLGWRTLTIAGRKVLTQVRFAETACVPNGAYGDEIKHRVRVLERGKYKLYEERKNEQTGAIEWVKIEEEAISVPNITMVPVYTNRTGFFEGEPALRSVAELNLEHWQSTSEQRVALTFLRFAMLCVAGVESTTVVEIGPAKVLKLPAGATAEYLEHTGAGIDAGRLDLEAIEKRMRSAGMDIRIENAGEVTATAAALDSADSNAALLAVADGLSDSLEQAVQYTADFLSIKGKLGTVIVNVEFADAASIEDADFLMKMRSTGDLSRETLWDEAQRRHVLSDDFNAEEEQERLDAEGPPMPVDGTGGNLNAASKKEGGDTGNPEDKTGAGKIEGDGEQ